MECDFHLKLGFAEGLKKSAEESLEKMVLNVLMILGLTISRMSSLEWAIEKTLKDSCLKPKVSCMMTDSIQGKASFVAD